MTLLVKYALTEGSLWPTAEVRQSISGLAPRVKLYCLCLPLLFVHNCRKPLRLAYSTVTDFARFLGLSTSVPRASAV